MKRFVWSLAIFCLLAAPAFANDRERAESVRKEVNDRDLADYLRTFNEGMDLDGGMPMSMAANDLVSSLNALSRKYITVIEMLRLVSDLTESGYYPNDQGPMGLYNFKYALETSRNNGFGTGKFGLWQFKVMKGECDQPRYVYYTTVTHPARKYTLAFWVSAGPGTVAESLLKGDSLKLDCH